MFALVVAYYVQEGLQYLMLAVGAFAIVHVARQRSDAYTAVDKLTKGKWLGILVASAAVVLLFGPISFIGIVGVVATFVYLADVRPKVDEIQRGPRW